MLLIPLPEERGDLVMQVHRDMGQFGTHRILDWLMWNTHFLVRVFVSVRMIT